MSPITETKLANTLEPEFEPTTIGRRKKAPRITPKQKRRGTKGAFGTSKAAALRKADARRIEESKEIRIACAAAETRATTHRLFDSAQKAGLLTMDELEKLKNPTEGMKVNPDLIDGKVPYDQKDLDEANQAEINPAWEAATKKERFWLPPSKILTPTTQP